jgi:hypothetical protein
MKRPDICDTRTDRGGDKRPYQQAAFRPGIAWDLPGLLGFLVQKRLDAQTGAAGLTLKKDAARVPLTGSADQPGSLAHDTTNLQPRPVPSSLRAPSRTRRNHGSRLRRSQPEHAA